MKLKKYNVVDIETGGLEINTPINFIGILTQDDLEDDGEYIILSPQTDSDFKDYLKQLGEPGHINIFHNGKFDSARLEFSYHYKIPVHHDTMILAYLCSTAPELIENRGKWLSLKDCAMRLLGVPNWNISLKGKTSTSRATVEDYLKKDLYYTKQIYIYLKNIFDKRDIKTYKLIMNALRVYTNIEQNGIPINVDMLKDVTEEYEEELKDIDNSLMMYANINWNSPKQLQNLLYNELKLPIPSLTNSGQPSTGLEAMVMLKGKHSIVDLILKRRGADKALTFLKDWNARQINGRLYANFNLHTTVTGRTSCNNPNLQQIPRNKRLKCIFRSTDPEWELVQLDYSQAELRTAGVVAKVAEIKRLYKIGMDLHTNMAALVAGIDPKDVTKPQRTSAKAINFGYLYGMQAKSFVQYAKISYGVEISLEDATHIRRKYFESYPELIRYYKLVEDELTTKGFITSIMGRRYKVGFKHLSYPKGRSDYCRKAINFPVQSTASDIMLCALIEIYDTLNKEQIKMVATVHDSVEILVRKDKDFISNIEKIQSILQHPKMMDDYLTVEWDVPLIADCEVGYFGCGIELDDWIKDHKEELPC